MKLITRQQAKAAGLIYYYTGKLCPHGHRVKRRVINRACWECHRLNWNDRHARNPYYMRKRVRKWQIDNSERFIAQCALRRARKHNAAGFYTADDVKQIFIKQDGKCRGCSHKLGKKFHRDHKVPLSRGGSNWPRNIQLLCPGCNDSKGAKTMREWTSTRAR